MSTWISSTGVADVSAAGALLSLPGAGPSPPDEVGGSGRAPVWGVVTPLASWGSTGRAGGVELSVGGVRTEVPDVWLVACLAGEPQPAMANAASAAQQAWRSFGRLRMGSSIACNHAAADNRLSTVGEPNPRLGAAVVVASFQQQ